MGITFPLLTAIYIASVLELSVLLPACLSFFNLCIKYSLKQFP